MFRVIKPVKVRHGVVRLPVSLNKLVDFELFSKFGIFPDKTIVLSSEWTMQKGERKKKKGRKREALRG